MENHNYHIAIVTKADRFEQMIVVIPLDLYMIYMISLSDLLMDKNR